MNQVSNFKIFPPSWDKRIEAQSKIWTQTHLWTIDLHKLLWGLALRKPWERIPGPGHDYPVILRIAQAVMCGENVTGKAAIGWARRFVQEFTLRWPDFVQQLEVNYDGLFHEISSLRTALEVAAREIYRNKMSEFASKQRHKLDILNDLAWRKMKASIPAQNLRISDHAKVLFAIWAAWATGSERDTWISAEQLAKLCGTDYASLRESLEILQHECVVKESRCASLNLRLGKYGKAKYTISAGWFGRGRRRRKRGWKFPKLLLGSPIMWSRIVAGFIMHEMRDLDPLDVLIWIRLACRVMRKNPRVSYAELEGCLDCQEGEQDVKDAVRRLIERGYVVVLRNGNQLKPRRYGVVARPVVRESGER